MRDRYKRAGLKILQWAVAFGAVLYVASQVDWRTTGAELLRIDPLVIAVIAGLTAVEFASRFSMWYVLLAGRTRVTMATSARIDLVIKFVNHVIPSKASGHSIAPLVLRHYTGIDWTEAVTIAGLNTGLYAALYGVVSLTGVVLFAPRLPGGLLVVVGLSTALYLVAGALILLAGRRMEVAGALFGGLRRLVARVPRIGDRLAGVVGKLPTFTEESAAVFRDLSARPSVVGPYALGWAGTLMIVPGLRVWLLLTALGGSFEPAALLPVVLVLAYSVTVLPITPGGVGVAEASATLVLTSLGVAPELAGVVVLLDRSFGVYLPALLGWIPVGNLDLSGLLAGSDEH